MAVHNADIAACFEEIAELLELADENPFRVRAYRNAARVVGEMHLDIPQALGKGEDLPKIPGVGPDLAGKMGEIAKSGTCKLLEQLRKRFPAGITELLRVPGLGPKRVRLMMLEGIDSLEKLRDAARGESLEELPGFGEKSRRKILEAVQARLSKARRFKLAFAGQYAEPLAKYLGGVVAGSYRRMKDTVGDLDFLVASDTPAHVTEHFVRYGEVKTVLAQGAPELREDQGELEAARRGTLPRLVELQDLRGDLHAHTRATDGRNTLREMALAARLLAAMDNPYVSILAHPTGRLLEARAPYDVDLLAVARKARVRGIALELNAHPDRLDLDDAHCRMAKEEGVLIAVSSDAHSVDGLDVLRYGVGQARRGWLEKKDVLNTLPLAELRRRLRSKSLAEVG
jgi:hypothetical protein